MFTKILIANRGEIACRVIETASRMGVSTVAVYSDADRNARHVAMADEAVHIGGSPVGESYLVGTRIVEAAIETGAQAIHPGYGFLSENPDFVDLVERAGLVFIGPSSASIRAMGLKDAAKRLMEKAGVPVVPGYHGEAQELVVLSSKAQEIGFPVLIKARAGGGGKGMRLVEDQASFPEALAAAKREAKASFGDDRVLVEKYVAKPRHIEVQVFGDDHGNVVHLFERDCSAQRRHQKVIEEAPAPGMDAGMRAAMMSAAVKAAKAIRYSGAGTIEFIVDASEGLRPDRFWFMEMNTRLQVEHPVTEMITGVDLVEWQLRVAAGEALPMRQEEIGIEGHAVEARLYAEDASRDFLPAIGTLHHLKFPERLGTQAQLRIDTGVRAGDTISPFYDPMIAKVIVHAKDRDTALAGLVEALDATQVAGSTVNARFLSALASDDDFRSGNLDTGLIARKQAELTRPGKATARAAAIAALAAAGAPAGRDGDPWSDLVGYGHFGGLSKTVRLETGEAARSARITARTDGRYEAEMDDERFVLTEADRGKAALWQGHVTVFDETGSHDFVLNDPFARAEEAAGGGDTLRAPMPGLVKMVRVGAGDEVRKGQALLVLEAMKMEHMIAAPHDGVISDIVAEGSQVTDGTVLVRFEEAKEMAEPA
jgi:3-methylcrotonyl-CoA carboxylase alpha subunit